VQQILEKGSPHHNKNLQEEIILKHFVELSQDKYGSNVAEKAVLFSDTDYRRKLWNVLSKNKQNLNDLFKMVNDAYANYVVQRLFETSDSKIQSEMYEVI